MSPYTVKSSGFRVRNIYLSTLNYQLSTEVIQVVIVAGFHLFPFRTEKLSPPAPMVLHTRGRVGSRRFLKKPFESNLGGLFRCMAGGEGTGGEPPGTAAGRDRQGGDRRRTAVHSGLLLERSLCVERCGGFICI